MHLVKLRSHDEFGDIVTRIRARTKAVDELASALSQIQAAEFFKGKLLRDACFEYALILH